MIANMEEMRTTMARLADNQPRLFNLYCFFYIITTERILPKKPSPPYNSCRFILTHPAWSDYHFLITIYEVKNLVPAK